MGWSALGLLHLDLDSGRIEPPPNPHTQTLVTLDPFIAPGHREALGKGFGVRQLHTNPCSAMYWLCDGEHFT